MIEYIKKNLLDTDCSVMVQGVNCRGVMGSGVARAIRDTYPEVFSKYHEHWERFTDRSPNHELLGTIHTVVVKSGGLMIINAFTQKDFGKDGRKYVSYDAVDSCFSRISDLVPVTCALALPRIGAGLGGGSWGVIAEIINFRLPNHTVVVHDL